MDTSKEDSLRKVFRHILFDLARTEAGLDKSETRKSFFERLEKLYDADLPEKRFRHYYSDIYSVLVDIRQKKRPGDIDTLSENIRLLREIYQPRNIAEDGKRIIDIHDALNKLYDHVNLDVARINYTAYKDEEVSGEKNIREIQTKLNEESEKVGELNKTIRKLKGKSERLQKEYISILGIFAAIVLSFTSGITFSTSVLANISQSNIYRIVIITLLIGLVLVNIFYALFFFVSTLVDRELNLAPFRISNIILILLIASTVLAWWFGVVELRAR